MPVNLTSCRPVVSSALISHSPLATASSLGAKLTCSVTLSPAWIVVPSCSDVPAVNAPPIGGFDFVIVAAVPPSLVIVKDLVALAPSATGPYWRTSSLMCSAAGEPATAESDACASPADVSKPTWLSKCPSVVGLNATLTVSSSPGPSLCGNEGSPVTVNGPL